MALLIILDFTHWAAWEDLPLIRKHKYILYQRGGGGVVFFVCNLIDTIYEV